MALYYMYPLIRLAVDFYRCAVEEKSPDTLRDPNTLYKGLLIDVLHNFSMPESEMRRGIHRIISSYNDLLIKNPNDLKEFTERVVNFYGDDYPRLANLITYAGEHDQVISNYMKNYIKELAIAGALTMYNIIGLEEKKIITPETMRIILNNTVKKLNEDPEDDDAVWNLDELLKSPSLDKKVIMRILRQVEPSLWSGYYGQTKKFEYTSTNLNENFFNKKHYNTDDANYLMNRWHAQPLTYSLVQQMLSRMNEAGQNIIKRGIYSDEEWGKDFMFDEVLQPIDIEGRPYPLKPSSEIRRVTNLNIWENQKDEETKNMLRPRAIEWGKVFADFGIIPYPDTF